MYKISRIHRDVKLFAEYFPKNTICILFCNSFFVWQLWKVNNFTSSREQTVRLSHCHRTLRQRRQITDWHTFFTKTAISFKKLFEKIHKLCYFKWIPHGICFFFGGTPDHRAPKKPPGRMLTCAGYCGRQFGTDREICSWGWMKLEAVETSLPECEKAAVFCGIACTHKLWEKRFFIR